MNEFVELMTKRRSVRQYKPDMIRNAELDQVLYAGLYAASGMDRQPCYFVAVREEETRNLLSTMNARILGKPDMDPFYGAPVVIVVFADTTAPTYLYDGSLALGNMMNAAHAVGLGSCWIHRAKEEFETETGKRLKRQWGIPETAEGIGHLVLGYPAGDLPEASPRKEENVVFLMEKKQFPALTECIRERGFLLNQSTVDYLDAIRAAGTLLVGLGSVGDSYVDSMVQREKDYSTYLGKGVAVAHGTLQGRRSVWRNGVSMVQFPDGVEFPEGKATLVFGVAGVGDAHMDLVSQISQLCTNDSIRERLNAAKTPEEVRIILKEGLKEAYRTK